MSEFTVYISQPSKDKRSRRVSQALDNEAKDYLVLLMDSGYSITREWYQNKNGYESVEITGVK